MRWLAAKLAALAGVTVALTWFRQPFDAWGGRFQYDAFDLEGFVMEPVPVGGSKDQARHFADWTIERGYADATGRRLSGTEYYELEGAANRVGTNLNQFLHAQGVQQFGVYHPADRFWTFQLIEAALFVAVAAVLIGVVVWRVRHRMI